MKKNRLPIKNKILLTNALTHRSWLNENEDLPEKSNERLEFLGDAVLELVVSEHLYLKFPNQQEGKLTALRASLVRTETLAKIATNLDLGEQIRLSKGEELGGGRKNESLLANTFESVVGAIYLESGKTGAEKFIAKHLLPELSLIIKNHLEKDAKSRLQEIIQARGLPAPEYTVLDETGPDHAKSFTVAVQSEGKQLGTGSGKSKQQAQQNAAAIALEKINPTW
jgi:ribonuclease-3